MTAATPDQIRELAAAIAGQCEAIAAGTLIGPLPAATARILANAGTLHAWARTTEADS